MSRVPGGGRSGGITGMITRKKYRKGFIHMVMGLYIKSQVLLAMTSFFF